MAAVATWAGHISQFGGMPAVPGPAAWSRRAMAAAISSSPAKALTWSCQRSR